MLVKMTSKGQITIPAKIRKQFNMHDIPSWQSHMIEVEGDRIVITPAPDADKLRKQLKDNLHAQGFSDEQLRKMANESYY